MIALWIPHLRAKAQNRPEAYLDDCFKAGQVRQDYLWISREAYEALTQKYRGWGDILHDWLTPSVRWFDRTFGTHLERCGGCARRQQKLNRLGRWLASLTRRLQHGR